MIAHYHIVAKLGEGGMGEVYRATDAKLGRDVAIKIIPEAFAQDADRMARFARESKVLASLNHPNIAAIYGVEENAIVMELVEGAMLRGPLPLDQALPIIHQLIDALEYAHDKGVVHRDLKPLNIKVTPEGRVKVLDFGLAAVAQVSRAVSGDSTLTMAGAIIGTPAYMAPEQARGHNVDRRADIWAFGVVVYEMLTGRRLFEARNVSDTLAAVLTNEPNLNAVPARVRRLLQVCLVKEPRQRLRHIGDARLLLDEPPATAAAPRGVLPWAAAGLLAIALIITGIALWRATRPADHPLLQFSVDLGPDAVAGFHTTAVLSPDGTRVVFPSRGPDGKQRLSFRPLNQPKATPLSGTENGMDPFFSPDGQWIGFFTDQKLKKISVKGGAPVSLCDAASARGGSWGDHGNIIFSLLAGGLFRVSDAGGTPQPLTKPAEKREATHRWPQILPGGEAVLFTSNAAKTDYDGASIALLFLKTGQWKTVYQGGYFGRYLPSGHLVYIYQGTLFGVPFDPARGELQGTPAPLLEEVAGDTGSGGGEFDFSRTGALVYLSGKSSGSSRPVVWLDSAGKTQPLVATPADYIMPRLSPDGKRLALVSGVTEFGDILVYDLQRDTMTKLSFTLKNGGPVWAPDGRHIVYNSLTGASTILWWIRADGAGEPQRLLESKDVLWPYSFSPDGRRLAYADISPETNADLWTLPLDNMDPDHPKPGKPEPFLRTPSSEAYAAFSPDGRWLAYQSNESGTSEVYVRPFPGPGGKWQISSGGGLFPVWSRHGPELLYETSDGHIMAAAYTAKGDTFVRDRVRQWSNQQVLITGDVPNFDLSPDGKRLVTFRLPQASEDAKASVHVTFLLNFFDELRRRMPAK